MLRIVAAVDAAYKTGFKSVGFSSSTILAASATAENLNFKPEKARGFELGAKGEFLDRRLTLTATAYRYSYRDIQSTSFDSVAFAFKVVMICSSLNLLRFMPSASFVSDSTIGRSHFRGARQATPPAGSPPPESGVACTK